MGSDVIMVIVVGTALAFDFTNGFHDTANVVATAISTRAIAPRPAVALAALLNFVGAFISLKVATTVAHGFLQTGAVTPTVVFAGLIGAIAWNIHDHLVFRVAIELFARLDRWSRRLGARGGRVWCGRMAGAS